MDWLRLVVGWTGIIVVGLLAVTIVAKMIMGQIDLRNIVSDAGGTASMSRFQLLVFTFVIALCFLYLAMARDATALPEVPTSVLTLLGISGTSFLVSKSIDGGRGKQRPPNEPVNPVAGPSRKSDDRP
jgi:hypothetical protein